MSEIAKLVGLTTAAITGTVDRMSQGGITSKPGDGLVERLPDPDGDRRSYRLGLTSLGKAKIAKLNATFETF